MKLSESGIQKIRKEKYEREIRKRKWKDGHFFEILFGIQGNKGCWVTKEKYVFLSILFEATFFSLYSA